MRLSVAEFWNALGQLYDSSLNTLHAVEELRVIAESHEKRLRRAELTIEATLEELKRLRERDNPPKP